MRETELELELPVPQYCMKFNDKVFFLL